MGSSDFNARSEVVSSLKSPVLVYSVRNGGWRELSFEEGTEGTGQPLILQLIEGAATPH